MAKAKCWTCGCDEHEHKCHMIKALEYYPDGKIKRIEYLTPADILAQPSILNLETFGTRQ